MKIFAMWIASIAFIKVATACLLLSFAFTVLTADKAVVGVNWHFSDNEVQANGE